jgi:hypothetical protein
MRRKAKMIHIESSPELKPTSVLNKIELHVDARMY